MSRDTILFLFGREILCQLLIATSLITLKLNSLEPQTLIILQFLKVGSNLMQWFWSGFPKRLQSDFSWHAVI